jgi:hypothetical protein
MKRARYELAHINHSYIFILIVCTSIKDVNLMCEDVVNFCTFIYFIITLFKHAIDTFSKWQLHILDSWDV